MRFRRGSGPARGQVLLFAGFAVWLTGSLFFMCSLLFAPASAQTSHKSSDPDWVINQAQCAAVVTPSDISDIPPAPAPCNSPPYSPKGLFVAGTAGGAACVLVMALGDSTSIQYSNVQPGAFLPVRARRIYATNTTCVGMVLLY